MVEAQGKEQSFKFIWLTRSINSFLTEIGESSVQVIFQGSWGFVSNLDRVLENSLRDNITLGWSRRLR
jgi:hypothetical protein